jgi:hypothetical protein
MPLLPKPFRAAAQNIQHGTSKHLFPHLNPTLAASNPISVPEASGNSRLCASSRVVQPEMNIELLHLLAPNQVIG